MMRVVACGAILATACSLLNGPMHPNLKERGARAQCSSSNISSDVLGMVVSGVVVTPLVFLGGIYTESYTPALIPLGIAVLYGISAAVGSHYLASCRREAASHEDPDGPEPQRAH
jgi:hypothetical protein